MGLLLARWRLLAALTGATLALGYVGVLHVELASERATVAMLDADLRTALGQYATCSARLRNILEREESDATVPDDLDGFQPDPDWLLPFIAPGASAR